MTGMQRFGTSLAIPRLTRLSDLIDIRRYNFDPVEERSQPIEDTLGFLSPRREGSQSTI
jgi:hypothetical protein